MYLVLCRPIAPPGLPVGLLLLPPVPLGHRPARPRALHAPVVLPAAVLPSAAPATAAPPLVLLLLVLVLRRGRFGVAAPGIEPAPEVLVAPAAIAT